MDEKYQAVKRHILCLLFGMLLMATGAAAQEISVSYQPSHEDFPNPERGFYIPIGTSANRPFPLDTAQLRHRFSGPQRAGNARYAIRSTLLMREYTLDTFRQRPLSPGFLDLVDHDLDVIREAGLKVILRFAYTNKTHTGDCPDVYKICPPYGDAPKAIVLQHIAQLAPLLKKHADVIAVLQEGFIGIWGENFYTDYFGDPGNNGPGRIMDSSWRDRNEVLHAMLDALPKDRMIQVRTPQIKQKYVYGPEARIDVPPLTAGEGFSLTDAARIGFHNDCFLSGVDDYGTYYDYGSSTQPKKAANLPLRRYLQQDSRYVAFGAETCDDAYSPENDCAPAGHAEADMAAVHISFLNAAYNNDVNNDWDSLGCIGSIRQRLGYRLVLRSGRFPARAAAGRPFSFVLKMTNAGYASPYNPRPVFLILRNHATGSELALPCPADPRKWFSGDFEWDGTVQLPAGMAAGRYDLLLDLPDPYPSITQRPEYSIRLANEDCWEERTGYNNLNVAVMVGAGGDGRRVDAARKEMLTLRPERIDVNSNQPRVFIDKVPCRKAAIIVMDMWDRHWCKSWTAREAAMIPRMNKVLAAARKRGVLVIFSPSSVANFYRDSPQRKAVLATPVCTEYEYPSVDHLLALDEHHQLDYAVYSKRYFPGTPYAAIAAAGAIYKGFPPLPPFANTGGCECRDRSCQEADVWTRQNKDLIIGPDDLIVEGNDKAELFDVCKARGLTHLLYMGGAGNMCLTSTRETSVINMANRGLKCVYLEDLMISISGNGYNPDTRKEDPGFTPLKGDSLVLDHLKKYIAPSAKSYDIFPGSSAADLATPVFTHDEVMSYVPRGPADCFRQISFDMNEKQVYADSVLGTFLSEQDPVKYAAFCKKIHLDAALLQALPQAGYATYRQTTVNTVYPGMKGDFFGETLKELHKQGLSGFGYIGIGWIMKYANEQPAYTEGDKVHPLICLNSPYRDRVIATTREVLNNYPVDGLRYDILDQPSTCRCDSCKKLYQAMFHDTMPAKWVDWQHEEKFRIESISRIVRDLYAVCKAIKPSVPVWQNWFQGEDRADISDVNYVDMSYLEFADPFRELFLNGVFDKKGIITGKVIENPDMGWKCLALGGHCYSYFASVGKTGLPDGDTSFDRIVPADWFEKTLAPFYARVQEVQPYLEDTHPVTNVAIVYDEKTRYHYDQYSRDDYMKLLREITLPLLGAGNPVRYISNVHLTTTSLDAYKAVILPETSGLSAGQLAVIQQFAASGGAVVVVGDALSYTADGQPLPDFAVARMMGVSRKRMAEALKPVGAGVSDSAGMLRTRMLLQGGEKPEPLYSVDSPFTAVTVKAGRTISWIRGAGGTLQAGGSKEAGGRQLAGGSNQAEDGRQPLVHVNPYGKGSVYYIASSAMPQLVACVLNDAGVRSPLRNDNVNGLAVLTKKDHENEWVLHLTDKGRYSLVIDKKYCGATKVAITLPAGMKSIRLRSTPDALVIDVDNENDYSAIVLR